MKSTTWRVLVASMTLGVATMGVATPAAAHSNRHDRAYSRPAVGSVLVHNDAGGTVSVSVAGETRVIREEGYAEITVPAGEVSIRATYRQFGATRTVERDRVYVRSGRTTRFTVDREGDARVMVENRTELPGELYVNGRYFASVAAFGSRVITLPEGRADLTLRAGSRELVSRRISLIPFAEPHLIAEAPRYADVFVDNPLPVAVRLVTDSGNTRTVEAHGHTVFSSVPVGNFAVTATRLSGERIDREVIAVRAYGGGRWCVDPPVTGVLAIDSAYSRGSQVYVNDRLVATLAPDAGARAVLALGWVNVEVRDDRGRCIERERVEIEPYDVARVSYGDDSGGSAAGGRHDNRDGYADRSHDEHRSGRDGVATR